jgi:SAM-dependent methyltransferase
MADSRHEANRRSWNEATRAHNSHKGDQARFLRDGGSTLFPEERELLGDVDGRALLHLQCNSGQDSLSLAKLGARVTGVDISDEAIATARRLSTESGIAAAFARADVLEWLDGAAPDSFELVLSSYGTYCWLSDLRRWARGIARVLRRGGRFVLVDFHPVAMMFDDRCAARRFPYSSHGEPLVMAEGIGDYVAMAPEGLVPWGYVEGEVGFRNPFPTNEFAWGIADIIEPLLSSGLTLETFREHPYANGARGLFSTMRELPNRRYTLPEAPELPLMLSLSARKQ